MKVRWGRIKNQKKTAFSLVGGRTAPVCRKYTLPTSRWGKSAAGDKGDRGGTVRTYAAHPWGAKKKEDLTDVFRRRKEMVGPKSEGRDSRGQRALAGNK